MSNTQKSKGTSRILIGIVCIGVILLIPWIVNNPAVVGASATKRELPVYCVERDDKVVSLTFDAGWGDVRLRHQFYNLNLRKSYALNDKLPLF